MNNNLAWWKSAVIYQIYPRSFCDSDGDGIGDLRGILSRLDYLETLGIDAVWLSPVFCSPQDDNGYDISDYRNIDPIFGTLEDMDLLIREAGKRGIRILMDLVLNHSSDEHRWFLEAKKSRENPFHDYYIWRDGMPDSPPDDTKASFGGSAWEWVPSVQQYYFHQFSVKQPDLNWKNPQLRQALYDMINWWNDRGIAGYRLDVVDHLGKDPDLGVMTNGPMLHSYIREMSRAAFRRPGTVTVGEAWSATAELAKQYSSPDGSELSMVFNFEPMKLDLIPGGEKWDIAPMDFVALKRSLARWQTTLAGAGWNSLFWENHDLPRSVSWIGNDGTYRKESAKMLAVALHGLQGTPFIYQGEELGMTNAPFALTDYRDIEIHGMVREHRAAGWSEERILDALHRKGRDNARTPMQWDSSENAGFSSGEPWIRVNPNYTEINAAEQLEDPDSVFHFYRRLIRLRKTLPVLTDGAFHLLLEEDPCLFAYTRQNKDSRLLVVCNFGGECAADPFCDEKGEVLLRSWPDSGQHGILRPYEAKMILSSL